MTTSQPKILETLLEGRRFALATIVEAERSTPQTPGASAVFSEAGLVAGTVGGGLLEAQVEAVAREALAEARARLISIGLEADLSDVEGAICGGAVRVLIDPGVEEQRDVFMAALQSLRRRQPGLLVAVIRPTGDDRARVERRWHPLAKVGTVPSRDSELGPLVSEGKDPTSLSWPRLEKAGDELLFAEYLRPLPRLIIAGAGHIGRAVAHLGRLLDFSVAVIDDRPEFASRENVPDADDVILGPIGPSVAAVEDADDNSFVIVTRGHAQDAEALRAALRRPAAYVGMIGSRSKIELMREEFLAKGWATADEWERIHAPIGLAIGSRTVEEIAVSIAAELVLVRSRAGASHGGRP